MADEQQHSNGTPADKGDMTAGEFFEQVRETDRETMGNIIFNAVPDPKLDPASPEFDIEAYKQSQIAAGKAFDDARKQLTATILKAFSPDHFDKALKSFGETMRKYLPAIQAFLEFSYIVDDPLFEKELQKPEYAEIFDAPLNDQKAQQLLQQAIAAVKRAKQIAAAMPTLESNGTPKYYTSPIGTLANALQANDGKGEVIGGGDIRLPVLFVNDSEKEVTTLVNATLENMDGISITGKPYTEYDRAVHDAAASIYLDRIKNNLPPMATAEMIYRTMTHKTDGEKVSPQQKAAVTRSMDKMSTNIQVTFDATNEMLSRKVKLNGQPVTSFKRKGFLLPAEKIEVKAGGTTSTCYSLLKKPMLLEYGELTKQLFTVNGSVLDIQEVDPKTKQLTAVSVKNNETRIAIKSYLLRRVEVMRRDEELATDKLRKYNAKREKDSTLPEKPISAFREQSRIIKIDHLFTSTGVVSDDTKTAANAKTKARDYIFQVLDYWQAIGEIVSYKTRKGTGRGTGKAVDAIIVEVKGRRYTGDFLPDNSL